MRKLTDDQLRDMTYEQIADAWERLIQRKDFWRYESYGERLMWWMSLYSTPNSTR